MIYLPLPDTRVRVFKSTILKPKLVKSSFKILTLKENEGRMTSKSEIENKINSAEQKSPKISNMLLEI